MHFSGTLYLFAYGSRKVENCDHMQVDTTFKTINAFTIFLINDRIMTCMLKNSCLQCMRHLSCCLPKTHHASKLLLTMHAPGNLQLLGGSTIFWASAFFLYDMFTVYPSTST